MSISSVQQVSGREVCSTNNLVLLVELAEFQLSELRAEYAEVFKAWGIFLEALV